MQNFHWQNQTKANVQGHVMIGENGRGGRHGRFPPPAVNRQDMKRHLFEFMPRSLRFAYNFVSTSSPGKAGGMWKTRSKVLDSQMGGSSSHTLNTNKAQLSWERRLEKRAHRLCGTGSQPQREEM